MVQNILAILAYYHASRSLYGAPMEYEFLHFKEQNETIVQRCQFSVHLHAASTVICYCNSNFKILYGYEIVAVNSYYSCCLINGVIKYREII